MFQDLINRRKLGGVNWLIWKGEKVAHRESEGYKSIEEQELMTPDTIFRIASMTKPVTSVLAMKLWEEGKFSFDDPITKWFPQFQNMSVMRNRNAVRENASRPITLLDLLTHRSGFTYQGFLGGDIDTVLSNEEWIAKLAAIPLGSQPGELFNYGRSTDLLGILISKIERKSLGVVMAEKIFDPLGMADTFFNVPTTKRSRCAANFGYDDAGNIVTLETVPSKMAFKERPNNLEFESGGQGLWSTIGDYLKFARLFVENGSSGGIRILKEDTINLMRTNQLTDMQREQSKMLGSSIFRDNHGFGLGVGIVMKEGRSSIPCSGSVGSVGWPGAYGGWWSADPVKKSVSIFLTHSMTEMSQLANGIGFELYEAIDIFSNYSQANT